MKVNFSGLSKINRTHMWKIFLWKLGFYKKKFKNLDAFSDCWLYEPKEFDNEKPYVVWINHSTFLIQTSQSRILTDPIWSRFCSPVPFSGFERHHPPALSLQELENIDYVLISHNHYDHLDLKTVKTLNNLFPQIKWVVPAGLKRWFLRKKIKNVAELNWWESFEESKDGRKTIISSVPAQHFSGRALFDFNKSAWTGYVFEEIDKDDTKRFYFAGDTAYNDQYIESIRQRWPKIDLGMISIGTYEPRIFMRKIHLHPEEAVKMHKDLNLTFSIGMHWKTFSLSDEPMDYPPKELLLAAKRVGLANNSFVATQPGVYVNW